ncbi:DUF4432 family protein [Paracoccus sp. S1E-3]|uniref:DUF4432 family protein n=1 Tax=Paracoccus sp. S1E-3 TaxID=2756130 RepID=UPI0015EF5B97|nr:DUF4432 family protein [Paracoccus sp. S1E-3]MBA4491047.1 DUF4432 family protein [Paracoccus sp. S1E-3]
MTAINLYRDQFTEARRPVLHHGQIGVDIWRSPTGVEMLRMRNPRGQVTILPFMGQMLWDASFDGLNLGMSSQFDNPRPAATIIGTYGCLGYHAGLLANGVPGPDDSHQVHGEFPTCRMDQAMLFTGEDDNGRWVELWGRCNYVEGFGPHYDAEPTVRIHEGGTMIDWGMRVWNRSAFPMPLQYMAHLNPAFLPGATIHQPAPFTPDRTQVRRAVPRHVTPTPDYLAFLDQLAADPGLMRVLDRDEYQPEQVFYIRDPGTDGDGVAHLMLRRPEGDGIALGYRPDRLPKLVRWIMANGDSKVAGFALPATSEPEGRTAELAKGNVIELAPGAEARFSVRFGYVTADEAEELAQVIASTGGEG